MTQAEIKSLKKGDYIRHTTIGAPIVFILLAKNKTRVRMQSVTSEMHNVYTYKLRDLIYGMWSIDKEYKIKLQIKEFLESN